MGELVIQVTDKIEKLMRGQGDNWKFSNSWVLFLFLVWRDNEREKGGVRGRGYFKYKGDYCY